MRTDRFALVDRIFQGAIEQEPAERQAYIDEACGDDVELRSRVQALLSADEQAGTFIEKPAYEEVSHIIEGRSIRNGQQMGPYRISSPLGGGGMGEVYLAEDLRLGRKVALKLLASHSIGDSQLRNRFLREARLASTLDHPNICTIYEVGEDSGQSYIAMQYVEGKTLKELVDREPLGLKRLLSISLQVANALEAAHSQGIIHRDIKPSNLMVTARGQAKVLDFGLAKLMDESEAIAISDEYRELTRTGAVMGTPSYMSPEQARGDRADHRSDIFSFGAVMYVMATGRVPFRGESPAETMNAVINDGHMPVAQLNKEAPSGLSALIDRALAKEPSDRYQSVTAMIADLRQVAQKAQVITSNEPDDMIIPYVPIQERAQFGRLRQLIKRPAFGLSLLSLLALVAVLIWWQPWSRPPSPPQQHLISTFPGHHRAASFSPDGSMIAFISDAGGVPQVWVKNLAQGDPLQVTFGEVPADRPRWSPNNDQIVFSRGASTSSHEIWSVATLGSTARRLIEGGRNPNWSWDGSQLVFEKGDEVWTARADGSEQRRLEGIPPIEFHLGDRMPAYSRDGSLIAFFQNSAGPLGDLWVIPSAGGKPRQLTSDIAISSAPVWLADDRYIVYSSQRAGSTTLWKVPTSGGKPEPVLISPGEDTDPELSRDGTKLIYTNTRNSYVVAQMNPATKQTRELREARNLHCDPSLSPQGDKIAFFALSDDGSHIFTMGVDGRNLMQVTREKGEQNSFPCWSPDGLFLYFSQHRPMPSLQRISLDGGPSSEIAPGWSWDVSNGVQVDPTGKLLVCSKMENGETVATIIREIESGKERVFGVPLRYPRWSADGKWILGTSRSASRFSGWVGEISICSVERGTCRQLTKDSKCPRWSADGSRVFFLRSGKAQYEEELWSISVTGEDERQIAKLQMHEISSYYDVSSKGEIVYVRFNPGRHELWLLEFHDS